MTPRWLTCREAAAYLGVSTRHLRRLVDQGLPHGRLGQRGDLRFVAADLDAYLRASAEGAAATEVDVAAFIQSQVRPKAA